MIGLLLAFNVGVLCPKPAVADLPHEVIQENVQILTPSHAGKNFGSQYLENIEGITFTNAAGLAQNRKNLAGVLVIDLWLMNKDRSEENLIVHQKEIHAIDFGHIFGGPGWTFDFFRGDADNFDDNWRFKHLVDPESIPDYLDRLEKLGPDVILSAIAQVPAEWDLTDAEREAIFWFLLHRQPLVRSAIGRLGL